MVQIQSLINRERMEFSKLRHRELPKSENRISDIIQPKLDGMRRELNS